MTRGDDYSRGFVGTTCGLICSNINCAIVAHGKPLAKWMQQDQVVFVLPAIKVSKSSLAFVIHGTWLSGDGLTDDVMNTASTDSKTPKQWVDEFMPYARIKAAKFNRLDEMEGDEEDLVSVDYQFGMDLYSANMPRVVALSVLPNVT